MTQTQLKRWRRALAQRVREATGAKPSTADLWGISGLSRLCGLAVLGTLTGVFALAPGHAAEGMWTLDNLPRAALKSQHGFDPDEAWIARVMRSAVRVGGCSASFVSRQGLVMTNHHCVTGCLTRVSTVERNLTETGFLAATREDEVRCPQMEVNRLERATDVTERVRQATAGLQGAAWQAAQDRERAALIRECQPTGDLSVRCDLVSLYRGGEYQLHRYRRYSDVRLVWVPEAAVGAFGGDPDNFDFPRWALDAAFLRAYDKGQPVRLDDHFTLQPAGPQAGEPLFIPGHPGSTQRLLTVAQLEQVRDRLAQQDIPATSEWRGMLHQYAQGDAQARRLALAALSGVENGLRVQQGQLAALLDPVMMARKRAEEDALRAFVNGREDFRREIGNPWGELERAQAVRREIGLMASLLVEARAFPGDLFQHARTLVRHAVERDKPEGQRLREFQSTALPAMERRLMAAVPVDAAYETARLTWALTRLRSLLGADHELVKRVLGPRSPQQAATALVTGTQLADPAVRQRLWRATAQEIQAGPDAMLQLALSLEPSSRALRQRWEAEVVAVEADAGRRIAQALFAMKGRSTYPDATGTLRLSHGVMRGWEEAGRTVPLHTDFAGLFARHTGSEPYAVPPSWLQARSRLAASGLESQPFNFVTDHDIIGGNSGSPMINRRGEVVGLVFDGNRHSLGGSFAFDERRNRSVSVHAGAIVQALRHVYRADALLRELGQAP